MIIIQLTALSFLSGDGNALLKLDSLSPNGKVTSNSKLSIKVTSTSTYTDSSMKAIVSVDVKKKMGWFGSVSVPTFVYNLIAPAITKVIKGVKHLSGK